MPPVEEVEAHLYKVLEGERRHFAARVSREEERRAQAAHAAASQVTTAAAVADSGVTRAREQADGVIQVAEERLQADKVKFAAEISAAGASAAEASRRADERIALVAAARDAALADVAARIAKAEEQRSKAVEATEAAAAEAEARAREREAEAARREEAAAARAKRHASDAQAREAQRAVDAERRAADLEEDARGRANAVRAATAERVELYLKRLSGSWSNTEREWNATRGRMELEARKAKRQAAEQRSLADMLASKGEMCDRMAESTRQRALDVAQEVRGAFDEWCASSSESLAEELDAFKGLEDYARTLRAGAVQAQ